MNVYYYYLNNYLKSLNLFLGRESKKSLGGGKTKTKEKIKKENSGLLCISYCWGCCTCYFMIFSSFLLFLNGMFFFLFRINSLDFFLWSLNTLDNMFCIIFCHFHFFFFFLGFLWFCFCNLTFNRRCCLVHPLFYHCFQIIPRISILCCFVLDI